MRIGWFPVWKLIGFGLYSADWAYVVLEDDFFINDWAVAYEFVSAAWAGEW